MKVYRGTAVNANEILLNDKNLYKNFFYIETGDKKITTFMVFERRICRIFYN